MRHALSAGCGPGHPDGANAGPEPYATTYSFTALWQLMSVALRSMTALPTLLPTRAAPSDIVRNATCQDSRKPAAPFCSCGANSPAPRTTPSCAPASGSFELSKAIDSSDMSCL